MNIKKILLWVKLFFSYFVYSQSIEGNFFLQPFKEEIKNDKVVQIVFLGDSHIQADWLTGYLRKKFQEKFGNAGRGLIFPYAIANSNGPDDFISVTNQTWENFRLIYEQDSYPQIGASGFVVSNQKESFLEIKFKKPEENFDKVLIFNDEKMNGETFQLYKENKSLSNFVSKSSERIKYTVSSGETFPELASKFYTTTTKLIQLNGVEIKNPIEGNSYQIDKISFNYNPDFENSIEKISDYKFSGNKTLVELPSLQNTFLMKSNARNGNTFYGIQFLKNVNKGVVFNTVGVNGATYGDFLKYPLQIEQLISLHPKLIVISLGTNESLSSISKVDFQNNVSNLISSFRKEGKKIPILLISPTDNALMPKKIKEIVSWIKEIALQNQVAFFNLYEATGGEGYFKKAIKKKEANSDGVHFLKSGYEFQAEKIWKALLQNF